MTKKQVQFITPINTIKQKVGTGGLSDDILDKAEQLLKENTESFGPVADIYLASIYESVQNSKKAATPKDHQKAVSSIIYAATHIKANGTMFHYPLATEIADKLIQFMEPIKTMDKESVELVMAFHTTLRAVIAGKVLGDGGQRGKDLLAALNDACERYFEKNR